MMFGGVFMMVFGLVALLLIIALPILLVVFLVQRPAGFPGAPALPTRPMFPGGEQDITCSHCSQKLQPEWAHCPHCGAPTR